VIFNETLFWDIDSMDLRKDKFFNELLKNSPKSIKQAVFKKYNYLNKKMKYNPLFDYLILNAIKDIKEQEKLLNLVKAWAEVSFLDSDFEKVKTFIHFLNLFNQKEVVSFLKKAIKDDLLTTYVARVNAFYDKGFMIIDGEIDKSIKFNHKKLKEIK
jgi:hypothetical protein